MKNSSASQAVKQVLKLTGKRVREKDLYLTSRSPLTTFRLRLDVVRNGQRVDLVRLPSSYLFAHGAAAFGVLFVGLWILVAPKNEQANPIGLVAVSALAVGLFYAHTMWVNKTAAQEDPVLSYGTRTKKLSVTSKQMLLSGDEVGVLLGISGIHFNAQKPETSRAELKLVFTNNGKVDFIVLATHFNSWLKKFDPQIIPFAEAVGIPYLHVDRNIATGKFTTERIV